MTMKRIPYYELPHHYDAAFAAIDEQICALIKKRKELANDQIVFPPHEEITRWAKEYDLYEDQIESIFGVLRNEEHYRPVVEPSDFQQHIPVFQFVEIDNIIYTVTFVHQYANASVVHLNLDWPHLNEQNDRKFFDLHDQYLKLDLGKKYDCREGGGNGTDGHITRSYIVSPPLPNDLTGIEFTFIDYQEPFNRTKTGFEFTIKVE